MASLTEVDEFGAESVAQRTLKLYDSIDTPHLYIKPIEWLLIIR